LLDELPDRLERREVSIWTVGGRRRIPFVCGERQRALLERALKSGECDLRPLADRQWMLDIRVEVELRSPARGMARRRRSLLAPVLV